ncbi:MAG TPA: response regulator transcription factor [Candidatus Limiplasma sp.]|nr:response regulator transcription factor [Candidatus Limiplasma sp.]HPS81589.1 response regulator transcription factor [Candidatus Limiplasma sp.]
MRLLVVEDDPALRAILVKRLGAEGYAVDACGNGDEGLDYALAVPYDGIVLDIMLPGISGTEILRQLRSQHNQTGVLLLTARDSIADRVYGLDLGADDYLIKPFSFDELLARIRTLLRVRSFDRSPVLKVERLTMDLAAHTVTRDGQSLPLTSKEYALLEYFMRNAGQVLTRDQILDHVWNSECSFETNLVDVYVRYLRGKIDADAPTKLLHTVRGVGYVLREESDPC